MVAINPILTKVNPAHQSSLRAKTRAARARGAAVQASRIPTTMTTLNFHLSPVRRAAAHQWPLRLKSVARPFTTPSALLLFGVIPKKSHPSHSHQKATLSQSATTSPDAAGAKTAETQSTYAVSVKEAASAGTVAGLMCLQAGTRVTTSSDVSVSGFSGCLWMWVWMMSEGNALSSWHFKDYDSGLDRAEDLHTLF